MSSRDRHNQSNRGPYEIDNDATDDQFIDESWNDDGLDEVMQQRPPRQPYRRTAPSTPASTSVDGTAAQIDRLRRAVRQTSHGQSPRSATPSDGDSGSASRPAQSGDYAGFDEYEDTAAPRLQQDARYQTAYDPYVQDEWEDDDQYARNSAYDEYDDEYPVYEESYDPRRSERSRPQVAMPTITRPTLPPAIANAAVVNDALALGLIGAGVASLAAMAILTANRIDTLDPGFASRVSASGVFEDIVPGSAFWNLPLMATMLTLMAFVIAWFVAPLDRFASRFVLGAALLIQFVTWVAMIRIL